MTEAQIMDKLRSVCSPGNPNDLYQKLKKVGQGASGSVYVAKKLSDGFKVAIKTMDLNSQPKKELIVNEILVMKESTHPNIVNFLDSFLVRGELWVVMEYMEGGALTDVIDHNSLEEDQISSICFEVSSPPAGTDRLLCLMRADDADSLSLRSQTCKGLQHLHAQHIIHRDIKSDNVLLDAQGHVKISTSLDSRFPGRCPRVSGSGSLTGSRPHSPYHSRLRFLCQAHRSKIQKSDDGGDAILDGT